MNGSRRLTTGSFSAAAFLLVAAHLLGVQTLGAQAAQAPARASTGFM